MFAKRNSGRPPRALPLTEFRFAAPCAEHNAHNQEIAD